MRERQTAKGRHNYGRKIFEIDKYILLVYMRNTPGPHVILVRGWLGQNW